MSELSGRSPPHYPTPAAKCADLVVDTSGVCFYLNKKLRFTCANWHGRGCRALDSGPAGPRTDCRAVNGSRSRAIAPRLTIKSLHHIGQRLPHLYVLAVGEVQ